MISSHSILLIDEILARMAIQVPGLEEDWAQDASTSQIYEERPLLRQTHKPRIQKAARPKPASAEATKSMQELLKEAWEAKAKKTASKKLAPPGILSFDNWRAKKRGGDYSHRAEKLSNESYSPSDEVTNPTVMFARQMIFEETNPDPTEANEILAQDVFKLEIDGTQQEDWDSLMEEIVIEDLPPPLHFRRTTDGIQIGHDLPIYPLVLNDCYHGPTKTIDVQPSKWKEINLAPFDEEPRMIKLGSHLTNEEVEQYKQLLLEFIDVFAWSYTNLKGMPPEIVQHTIPLFSDTKPIRKLQHRMNPRMQLIVKAELERLLQITDWVSPMVLVKKKNGKIQVCINYRTLNRRTQKDHFPLPFINTILDEVAGHKLYTFIDGYSGYNQISIAPKDHHKTAFITPWGTFIYVVMPFGLCNAPSAFQRAMSFAFSNLIHHSMTIFIDDFSTHSSVVEHLY